MAGGLLPNLGISVRFQNRQAMKLGHPPRQFRLSGAYPAVPLPIDWTRNDTLVFPLDGNNVYGDCMYAAACHADNTFTGNNGTESSFGLNAIIQDYLQLSPNDTGLNVGQITGAWRNGLANIPAASISGVLSMDPTDAAAMQAAIYFFGGVFFMLSLPDAWLSFDNGTIWDAPAVPDPAKGHAVWWNGVDGNGNYKLQTWGEHGWITPAGVRVCDPSCFVVFSMRWFNAQGIAPNGLTYTQLGDLWEQFGGFPMPSVTGWTELPGGGQDIGVGANGSVCIIGGIYDNGDYSPFRYDGAGWDIAPGAGIRIAVGPDGMPWMIDSAGSIFHWENGGWQIKPGGGQDIGVGADGSVWIIGDTRALPGGPAKDYNPFRWNGAGWDIAPGAGIRIAVGPDGMPWMIDSAGSIFHWENGGWQIKPGGGQDIGVGADGSVWIIGGQAVTSTHNIPCFIPQDYNPFRWNGVGWDIGVGAGVDISVGPDGTPWMIDSAGSIFHGILPFGIRQRAEVRMPVESPGIPRNPEPRNFPR